MIGIQESYSNEYPLSKPVPKTYPIAYNPSYLFQQNISNQGLMFDGKRVRKSVNRKTVDYNSSIIRYLEDEIWERDVRDITLPEPDTSYTVELQPPLGYVNNPMNAVTTKFIRTATNKIKCPIFSVLWTPDGRRLITGASSGEFTLWNGLTFNFETILQAHDSSVRSMVWSHNDHWMITADHGGYIKYWQSNMNNVKMFQAHKEAIRGLTFSPLDSKFASCSDDGTLRIWDFERCCEEKILRGHGSDVKSVDWHPFKALIASGSKDNQQPVKLWDPRSGQSLATIHSHKGTVMSLCWNTFNGNWLITGSRDHSIKLYDIRNLREEVQSFKGHKKDVTSMAWHPIHEGFFVSGSADGTLLYWTIGSEKDVGGIEQAHDSIIWSLSWHPLGHILVSGSNDHTTKFWTRNRPGDVIYEKDHKDYMNPVNLSSSLTNNEEFMTFSRYTTDHSQTIERSTLSPIPQNMVTKDGLDSIKSSFIIPGLDITETPTDPSDEHDMKIQQQNLNSFFYDHALAKNYPDGRSMKNDDVALNNFQDDHTSNDFIFNNINMGDNSRGNGNFPIDFTGNAENQFFNRVQDVYHILNGPINSHPNSQFENEFNQSNNQNFSNDPSFGNQNFARAASKIFQMNPSMPMPNNIQFSMMANLNRFLGVRQRNDNFHINNQNANNKSFFGQRMFNLMNRGNRPEFDTLRNGPYFRGPLMFPRHQGAFVQNIFRLQNNFIQRPS